MTTMTTFTLELSESLKSMIEQRAAACKFADAGAYVRALIVTDLQRDEINRMLMEAEDAYERGEYTEWKPGDSQRLLQEMLRQREASSKT
jgi:Arc/MetJ-type ribon-helix-helix transcriptional regulator